MTTEELIACGFRPKKTTINPWQLLPEFMLETTIESGVEAQETINEFY